MKNLIKKIVPKQALPWMRSILNKKRRSSLYLKYRLHKLTAGNSKTKTTKYHFAILCIKKTVYADMVIDNINSLHYLNPNHEATLYCDTICFDYLNKKKNKFTYPKKVIILDSYSVATKPWQHYKIDVHIKAAWNDQIDTDADGFWHNDPVIDKNKVTTLVLAYPIQSNPNEIILIEKIFNKPKWAKLNHYVAAFVSIPKQFMTEKIARDLQYFNDTIFYHSLDFISDKNQADDMRRLSEEFAISLTIQTNFSPEMITTLKTEDGPGSKNSLQSLYYGCINRVIE